MPSPLRIVACERLGLIMLIIRRYRSGSVELGSAQKSWLHVLAQMFRCLIDAVRFALAASRPLT
jgi:hypothetical protein